MENRGKGLFPNAGYFIEKGVKISRLTGRRMSFWQDQSQKLQ
nr:MAG TPA: hypothetical protein [Caudoviricetes sp.]